MALLDTATALMMTSCMRGVLNSRTERQGMTPEKLNETLDEMVEMAQQIAAGKEAWQRIQSMPTWRTERPVSRKRGAAAAAAPSASASPC